MLESVGQSNSAEADLETLNGMARALERSEARRLGTTLIHARKAVARRIGITACAFENYLYQRTKVVPHWLMNRIHAELVSVLQLEMQKLEHELQLHLQTGSDRSGSALVSAEAQLAAARKVLAEAMK